MWGNTIFSSFLLLLFPSLTMISNEYLQILTDNLQIIRDNLIMDDLLDWLLSKGVLDHRLYTEIKCHKNPYVQIDTFLAFFFRGVLSQDAQFELFLTLLNHTEQQHILTSIFNTYNRKGPSRYSAVVKTAVSNGQKWMDLHH